MLKGSSTIEAALIVPMILTVIFMLLYLTLFLYTKAEFTRNAYISVLRGSQAETQNQKARVKTAENMFKKLAAESYVGNGDYKQKIVTEGEKVKITIEVSHGLPRSIFMEKGLQRNAFACRMTFYAKTNHPAEFIRKCRNVKAAAAKVKKGTAKTPTGDSNIKGGTGKHGDTIQTGSK